MSLERMQALWVSEPDGITAQAPGTRCRCGRRVSSRAPRLGCVECGASCCASCAVTMEAVVHCRPCAVARLGPAATPNRLGVV